MIRSNTQKSANILISIFVILSVLLSIGGNLLYRYQKKNISVEKHKELAAISKLKVDQIANWRREQLANAHIIFNNQAIIKHISEYNHGAHNNANYQIIHNWVNSLFENYEYVMISLVDPSGKFIINSSPKAPLSDAGKKYIEQARLTKNIVFSDLFRYNDTSIYMDLVVPLYLNPSKREMFSGVAFLRIDPNKYLYSKILKWPTQGKSSEVILVRHEGDSVLFMSDLKHKKNSALRLRKSMKNKQMLIVQAINGKKGILEGIDYSGVSVLGDVQTVPGSPWFVVTKIDSAEIFNPIISMATWIFVITFLLILIAAGVIYYVWKRKENEGIIINQQHLQELVDEQTIYLKDLNDQLQNDIAERKLIEEKLRESEQRLSFHFDNSPLAVVEWDAQFIVTQWSKEAEHIFGWKTSETLGKPISDLHIIYEEDIPIVNRTKERLSGGKENVVIFSNRNYTRSGTVIETTWYNTILNDETGKMSSVMSLVEDITERKKTEDKLRKLSQAVEQNPISIVITDINGIIEYGNPRVSNITGYTPEELLGKKPNIFKSDETPEKIYKELWDTILAGKEWQGEFHNKKKNGELYWEAASISPIVDNEGNITHFLALKEDITQRKLNQEELKRAKNDLEIRVQERTAELAKSEERFRTTLDNLMEGCMFVGYDWTFLYVNDAVTKQLNKDREELIGHTMMQIFPDRSFMPALKWFQIALLQRQQNHFVEEVKFADGSAKWFDFRVEPVTEGIFVMSDDITSRIIAEQKLIKSESELKYAQQLAHLGNWTYLLDKEQAIWSDEMYHIYGLDPTKRAPNIEDHRKMFHPDDLEMIDEALRNTLEKGIPYNIDFRAFKTDGKEIYVNSICKPLINEKGVIFSFTGTNQDITEKKLADKALKESEEGFRTLAESVPQFIWITDSDGQNIYFNQNWTEYTGMTMDESHGAGWNKPFHPEDQLIAWNAWKEAIDTGANYDLQCRLRKYDGEYHWFVVRGTPLKDSNGNIIRWYGTYTEIDSQKQTEEELEKRVVERTAQLLIANKELEAFAYSVSHDLRAPLRSIDGWSLALLEDCATLLDKQGIEYLDRVRSETQRMGYLIDDLLKLSRVSRVEIKKIDIDLSTLAQDIIKRLLKTPTERRFDFIIQPGMFSYGDPQMMEIALTNLLDNAYKFTGKQPLARIEFGQSLIDNKQTFWVKDNGVGFDMSYSKNLFGAFQRMHKQSDFPGTGVGLATVQRIIHRHNGVIWAESNINQGTTFYFTLT